MKGYYDAEKEMFIDCVPTRRRMKLYTADNVLELVGVIGAWLKGNTLMVTVDSGRNFSIYEYPNLKAAQKALNVFWEHFDKHQLICCI
jgi:hypothetical protein